MCMEGLPDRDKLFAMGYRNKKIAVDLGPAMPNSVQIAHSQHFGHLCTVEHRALHPASVCPFFFLSLWPSPCRRGLGVATAV